MFFLPYFIKFLVYRKNFDIVIYQRREGGILFSGFFVGCVVWDIWAYPYHEE
jgi:hypothetical protein